MPKTALELLDEIDSAAPVAPVGTSKAADLLREVDAIKPTGWAETLGGGLRSALSAAGEMGRQANNGAATVEMLVRAGLDKVGVENAWNGANYGPMRLMMETQAEEAQAQAEAADRAARRSGAGGVLQTVIEDGAGSVGQMVPVVMAGPASLITRASTLAPAALPRSTQIVNRAAAALPKFMGGGATPLAQTALEANLVAGLQSASQQFESTYAATRADKSKDALLRASLDAFVNGIAETGFGSMQGSTGALSFLDKVPGGSYLKRWATDAFGESSAEALTGLVQYASEQAANGRPMTNDGAIEAMWRSAAAGFALPTATHGMSKAGDVVADTVGAVQHLANRKEIQAAEAKDRERLALEQAMAGIAAGTPADQTIGRGTGNLGAVTEPRAEMDRVLATASHPTPPTAEGLDPANDLAPEPEIDPLLDLTPTQVGNLARADSSAGETTPLEAMGTAPLSGDSSTMGTTDTAPVREKSTEDLIKEQLGETGMQIQPDANRTGFDSYLAERGMDAATHARLSASTEDVVPWAAGDQARVAVGKSGISGKGILAKAEIRAGEPAALATDAQGRRTPVGRFINHSDQPNSTLRETERGLAVVPRQTLRAGEEVTIDYREADRIREGRWQALADARARRTPEWQKAQAQQRHRDAQAERQRKSLAIADEARQKAEADRKAASDIAAENRQKAEKDLEQAAAQERQAQAQHPIDVAMRAVDGMPSDAPNHIIALAERGDIGGLGRALDGYLQFQVNALKRTPPTDAAARGAVTSRIAAARNAQRMLRTGAATEARVDVPTPKAGPMDTQAVLDAVDPTTTTPEPSAPGSQAAPQAAPTATAEPGPAAAGAPATKVAPDGGSVVADFTAHVRALASLAAEQGKTLTTNEVARESPEFGFGVDRNDQRVTTEGRRRGERLADALRRDGKTVAGLIKQIVAEQAPAQPNLAVAPPSPPEVASTPQEDTASAQDEATSPAPGDGDTDSFVPFSPDRIPGEGIPEARSDVFGTGSPAEQRAAAKEFIKTMDRAPVYNASLGHDIGISGAGLRKVVASSAEPRRLHLLPVLRDLLARGTLVEGATEAPDAGNDAQNVRAYHWLQSDVRYDGAVRPVKIRVREDGNGFWHYNHDIGDVVVGNRMPPAVHRGASLGDPKPAVPALAEGTVPDRSDAQSVGDKNAKINEKTVTPSGSPANGNQAQAERTPGDMLAVYSPSTARLAPEPLSPADQAAKPVINLRRAITELADWLGATVYDRKLGRGTAGYYAPSSAGVVLRRATDLDVAAHEIGHWSDDRFGVLRPMAEAELAGNAADAAALDGELAKFWDHGSQPPSGMPPPMARMYRRGEGLAEYLRAWMVAPAAAERMAPMLTANLRAAIPADVMARFRQFGDDMRRFYHADGLAAGGANIRALGDTGQPTLRQRLQTAIRQLSKARPGKPLEFGWADRQRVHFTDSLAPLMKSLRWVGTQTGKTEAGTSAERLVRLLGGINDKQKAILDNGMIMARWIEEKNGKPQLRLAKDVGGGIDWLGGWVDTASQATIERDLNDLTTVLVSQTAIEDAGNIDKDRAAAIAQLVAKAQGQEAQAREALDVLEQQIRARAASLKAAQDRHTVGRVGEVRDAVESAGARNDADAAALIDRGQASEQAASAMRAKLAARSDSVSRSVLKLYEAVDKNSAEIDRRTAKVVAGMRAQMEARIASRYAAIARQEARWAQRDAARKARLTGQGGGMRSDIAAARSALADAQRDPARWTRLQEGARRYRAWADGVLRYMVDKGRLSEDQYRNITTRHQQYAALNRIVEADGGFRPIGGAKLGSAKDTVQGRSGSTREIENPLVSLIDNTMRSVAEADRNEAMRAVVDTLDIPRSMWLGTPLDLASIAVKVEKGGNGAVSVFRNGTEEFWKFSPEIEQGVKGLWEQYRVPAIASLPATVIRATIVNSPGFAIRNRIRDVVNRLIIGQVKPKNAAEAVKRLAKQFPGAQRFSDTERAIVEMAGAAFAGHQIKSSTEGVSLQASLNPLRYLTSEETWHSEIRKRMGELRQDKSIIVKAMGAVPNGYMNLIKNSEFVGRADEFLGLYRQLRAEGVDEQTAALMAGKGARDLVDFAVAGTWLRTMNQIIPFLNAAVQGMRATKRAVVERPAATATRWALYAAVPSILAYLLAGDDEDRDRYVNMPAWRRDMFWNIRVGPDTWLAIPKPFELGALGGSAERLVQAVHEVKNGAESGKALAHAFEGHAGSLVKALLPVDEGTLAAMWKPLVETTTNHDFFTDRPIISAGDMKRNVEDRTGTAFASRLGQAGQFISGDTVDARNVDHLIRGFFGEIGSLSMATSDLGREDKAQGWKRLFQQASGIVRSGAADQQADVQRMLDVEQDANRVDGKPEQRIQEMKRDYWKATTGEERERLAAVMRAYARGEDFRLPIDRAAAAANQLQSALLAIPQEGRASWVEANSDALGAARMMDRLAARQRQMEKRGVPLDEQRAMLKDAVEAIRAVAPTLFDEERERLTEPVAGAAAR